jgi:predicted dehydrogenase
MTHAVIGTGHWGANHARVAVELADEGLIDDVILCDIDEDRAAGLADSYGVRYTTTHTELIGEVDTAVVATPSPTHRPIATELLTGGVDCLIEKPLALTSEDAWKILEAAKTNNQIVGVGHIFRYHPALRELHRRIERGELGDIRYLRSERYSFREPRETTGVLYQLAVHDLDIYRMLLGDNPESIYCRLDEHLREGIDETASIVVDYGDVTGVINESWQVPVFGKRRELVVAGTERSAYIDYLKDTELQLFDAKVTEEGGDLHVRNEGKMTYEVDGYEPLKLEVEDFVTASREGRTPNASGEIGAQTVKLLEYAKESARTNSVVEIE